MTNNGTQIEQQVRWGDMDALGHVNNTLFFRFCESARIQYFEDIELMSHASKPTDGPGLVAANLNFRKQLKFPDTVVVRANTSKISRRAFHLDYVLTSKASGDVVADGSSVCVWVDYESAKALPLPQGLIDAIVALENNPDLVTTAKDNSSEYKGN